MRLHSSSKVWFLALLAALSWGSYARAAGPAQLNFDDVVDRLSVEGANTEVVFKRHAAVYEVLGANARAKELVKTLEESRHEQTVVTIQANATTMEISEAKPKRVP